MASGHVETQQEIPGALASIPRPRPVRLKQILKIIAAAVLVVLLGLALYSPWFTLVILLLSVISLWSTAQKQNKVRRLLVEGEIAMACVTSRRLEPEGVGLETGVRWPVIGYEFQSSRGDKMYGESLDYSNKYFEDMYVPVFYDAQTLESGAICGSCYEVIMPG